MFDDLEAIANLEYGKAVERISREAQEKLRRVQTMPRGGQMEYARLEVDLDQSEESCRAYAQIWQNLIEAKSGGHLTREDVNFIIQKVQQVIAASKRNLMNAPNPWRVASAGTEIAMRMDRVEASIRRDLEIRIRKQQAFPKKEIRAADDPEDRRFARLAIEEARKSVPEKDGKPHPMVGAVVIKNGNVLAIAHRGEAEGNHAEYIALEKRLADAALAGATVYTTLEPCTTRNHPKIPCVDRLIERKVGRVVIGMLDPDRRITGQGQRRLRSANIITDFFPHDLMAEVEDLNREFTRKVESAGRVATTQVLDKWVTPGYEHKPGVAAAPEPSSAVQDELYVELRSTFAYPKMGDLAFQLLEGKYKASGRNPNEVTTDCDVLVELYGVNRSNQSVYIKDFAGWLQIGIEWRKLQLDDNFHLDDVWSGSVEYGLEHGQEGNIGREPAELPSLLPKKGAEIHPREPIEGWLKFTAPDVNPRHQYSIRVAIIDSLGREHHLDKAELKERKIGLRKVRK